MKGKGDKLTSNNPASISISHRDLLNIDTNNQAPVLVVGMHNSGTSILAKILHKSGVFLGNSMNHYESHFFSIFVNDSLIMQGEKNWTKLPIMSIDEVMSFSETIGPFVNKYWIVDYLQWGYDGVSMWGIKDPRLCVLLPLYLNIFPAAKVVHIRRNPNDVAASLCLRNKRGVGRYDNFEHWKQLTLAYTDRVVRYSGKVCAYHELQYEDFCTTSEDVVQKLFDFLGVPFTDNTKDMLSDVYSSKIGSYEKYRKNKMKLRLKTIAKNLLRRVKPSFR